MKRADMRIAKVMARHPNFDGDAKFMGFWVRVLTKAKDKPRSKNRAARIFRKAGHYKRLSGGYDAK